MNQNEKNLLNSLQIIIGNNYAIFSILAFVIFVIIIWIFGRFFKVLIGRIQRFSPNLINGIKFLTTFFQLYFITLGFFSILGASREFLIGLSALLVTVIGFASTSIASNIFGGIYLIVTRPFRVGDLINTQGDVGIVEEIGLNYTRIVKFDRTTVAIPNNNLINASLLNYNIDKTEGEVIELHFSNGKNGVESPNVIFRESIELQLNIVDPPIPLSDVIKGLDKVCEEYESIFGFKPQYYFGQYNFRLNVRLLIAAYNGFTIFNSWPYFLESITSKVYEKLQKKGESEK